jgi:site-specific recombinase XerD
MRSAGGGAYGHRLRGLVVIMWRAGLRIQEAIALTEGDLGATRGRHWSPVAVRGELRRTAAAAGARRRFAAHQLRHAHAVESGEIIETVHARRAPLIPVSASLRV